MKKTSTLVFTRILAFILIFSLAALTFASCTDKSVGGDTTAADTTIPGTSEITAAPDDYKASVAVLNGTTGFGIAPLCSDFKAGKTDFIKSIDFYADATLISPLMISGSVDIAAVPTNLAAVLFNKTEGKVRVVAINTLGVLYIVENGDTVKSLNDLVGKKIAVPGQGSNPEYVLKALLKAAGIEDKVEIDYSCSSPDEVTTALATGSASIGLIPEPKVTAALTKNASLRVAVDVSAEWKKTMGTDLVQGCLVAGAAFCAEHPQVLDAFLKSYSDSISLLSSDPDTAAKLIVEAGIAASEGLVKNALPRCNIVFISGKDMAEPLNKFWSSLYEIIPQSVGGKLPDETVFYAPEG